MGRISLSLQHIIDGRTMAKNQQTPKLMSLLRMRDILEPHLDTIRRQIYFDDHLALIHGSVGLLKLLIHHQPPFTFDDRRMGVIVKGEAFVNINLVDKHLKAGMLAFIGPGTIISPVRFSPDFELYGFGIPADFPLPGQLPQALNGQVRDFQLPTSEANIQTALNILDTLWQVVHQENYNMQTVSSLIYAQMNHYDALFRQYTDRQQYALSHEQTIFDRFIQLVNLHAVKQHQIAFYAERMCLTERYLGTVIRQASGVTAKEWIDRAIIARIKVELRYTEKTVTQISEDMNFNTPSFFNKYFKRLTQMTPAEFRSSLQ